MKFVRNTAALEALKLCWKFYPWRVRKAMNEVAAWKEITALNSIPMFGIKFGRKL